MGFLGDVKALIVAIAVAVFMASGWYSCAKVGAVRLDKARTEIATLKADAVTLRTNIADKDRSIEQLSVSVQEQNKKIDGMVADGEALRVSLSDAARRHAAERARLLKQLSEMQPLPEDCREAVRMTARQIVEVIR